MALVPPRSPPPLLIEIEDEAGARKEYLNRFSDLCADFFNLSQLHSEIILGMVEFSRKIPGKGLQVNWDILEAHKLGIKDREVVMKWLISIGIPGGIWRYPEDFPLYIEAKRQRRAIWHEQTANRLQLELERLILYHLQASSKTIGDGLLSTLSMLIHFNRFLSKFHSYMGAVPLIRGLRDVFKAQIKDLAHGLVWVLDDASLTQSGTDHMTLTAATLISTLGFRPCNSNAQGQREWLVHPHLTHFQLYLLVSLIDSYKLVASGTAGNHHVANPVVNRSHSFRSWSWVFSFCLSLLYRPLARLLILAVHIVALIVPNCITSLL
ncbi:hypothetical protein DSO57_1033142 [Entomophthora muscae]|uniref:Uncharacterized protein n=1 Tax=Entomophthora muscae TaxID=34485 RepID=A0ACC2RR20_9FUNG|nr:hypothetical protein DSO57_1033142 [Entomophthora muscae]